MQIQTVKCPRFANQALRAYHQTTFFMPQPALRLLTILSRLVSQALAPLMILMISVTSTVAFAADPGTTSSKSETQTETKKTKTKETKTKETKKGDKTVNPHVIMETSLGNVEIELFEDKAPISVANFLKYTDEGFFNGTIFHRVIPNFMIQGGGFTPDMNQKKTADQIKNEAGNGLKNERGTLAMARTAVVDSATSQFFINLKDNDFLNYTAPNPAQYGYAVFGKVVSGLDVVEKIKDVPTGNKGMHQDVPTTPVLIKSMKRK